MTLIPYLPRPACWALLYGPGGIMPGSPYQISHLVCVGPSLDATGKPILTGTTPAEAVMALLQASKNTSDGSLHFPSTLVLRLQMQPPSNPLANADYYLLPPSAPEGTGEWAVCEMAADGKTVRWSCLAEELLELIWEQGENAPGYFEWTPTGDDEPLRDGPYLTWVPTPAPQAATA